MLTDPTSASGYAFGEVLPSAHMTTIATQQPDALDGAGGGSYTLTAPIIIGGDALEFIVGGLLDLSTGTLIADSDNQTLDPADGIIQEHTPPAAANLDHDLVAAGNKGRVMCVIHTGSAFSITIRRSGFAGNAIVTLPGASVWSSAWLRDDGTNWRLLSGLGCTTGNDA